MLYDYKHKINISIQNIGRHCTYIVPRKMRILILSRMPKRVRVGVIRKCKKMIKKIQTLKNFQILSKEDQKKVNGGEILSCKCRNSTISWAEEYNSYADAESDLKRYCGSASGICIHVAI